MSHFGADSANGWIKICGVRDVATAIDVARQAPSAIGLNFFAASPRAVTPTQAAEIVQRLGGHLSASTRLRVSALPPTPIGLFLNHRLDEIEALASQAGLSAIQLHGDEPPEFLRTLHERHPDWSLLKAFRVGDSLRPVAEFVAECQRLSVPLAGCLLDARVPETFGGTGHVAPWELIAKEYDKQNWPPLILAGGLTPDNVAEAIQIVQPFGVDTASGVESSPGVKERKLLARFVAEARRAFAK